MLTRGRKSLHNSFAKPSHDIQLSLYWTKMFLQDNLSCSGNLVLFTQNKDIGEPWTRNVNGKKIVLWGQPQIWFNLNKAFAVGSQITLYYNVYSYSEGILVYPAIGAKFKF